MKLSVVDSIEAVWAHVKHSGQCFHPIAVLLWPFHGKVTLPSLFFFFFPPSLYFFLREFFFRSIVGLAPLSDTCPRDVLRGTRLFENTRSDPEENGRFSWSGTKLDRCCGPLQSVEKSSLITLFTGQHFNTFSVPSSSSFSECLDPDFSWTWPNNVL